MRFKVNLKNYVIRSIPDYIVEVNNGTIDYKKLADEIEEFNEELNWDGMWTIDDARDRLLNNWKLILFIPETKIKGWYWLDDKREPRNIYVNKEYRGLEIAKDLNFKLLNICKMLGMEEVECEINDWNLRSMRCFKKAGWVEYI